MHRKRYTREEDLKIRNTINNNPENISKALKELEADGLIIRKDYGEIPPRVEYSLSERGKSLEPVLDAFCLWGQEHRND